MPFKKLRKPIKARDYRKSRENINNSEPRLSADIQVNLEEIRNIIGSSPDVIIREFKIRVGNRERRAALLFVDGMTDKMVVNETVMEALLVKVNISETLQEQKGQVINTIVEEVLTNIDVSTAQNFVSVLDDVFSGDTALLVDGENIAIIIRARFWQARNVEEPNNEVIISGPKEGFVETLRTNTALLRHKLKTPKLRFEPLKLGTLTKTDIVIAYIDGVVDPKIIDEVRKRVSRIETDGIIDSHQLYEFIEDNPWALLPQGARTERPDRAAAHLMEGGALLMVDGTPSHYMLPYTFFQYLSSPDDYYERVYISFFLRILRFTALLISLMLPSFYIAVTTFHQEMIPSTVLQTIVNARRGVPYPALVEALVMELIIELVREAGVRLPRNVGPAISIVGALVLGQAAIQSKLASSIMVVVVSSTAIASFTMPTFSTALSLRILRFPLMLASGFLGLYGMVTASFLILVHLSSLRSFGVPFLAPVVPFYGTDFKDAVFRLPIWMHSTRTRLFRTPDPVRQEKNLKPEPPGSNPNERGPDNA